jgi:hypothetical protein
LLEPLGNWVFGTSRPQLKFWAAPTREKEHENESSCSSSSVLSFTPLFTTDHNNLPAKPESGFQTANRLVSRQPMNT